MKEGGIEGSRKKKEIVAKFFPNLIKIINSQIQEQAPNSITTKKHNIGHHNPSAKVLKVAIEKKTHRIQKENDSNFRFQVRNIKARN